MIKAGMSTQGLDTQVVMMMARNLSSSWGLHTHWQLYSMVSERERLTNMYSQN